ncbi:hypothetical protein JWJ88_16860 [Paracoccus methylovorus]|uniref:DUF4760 domain-containing protein n=1 Tax=Paracoccus methylovorus TaxID=2812658 RepID=A0ABX7JK80_9RHOB|nr:MULTISPECIES: hypothetical protein [Paracoccus]QRZ14642.1 hypothetical protein JWJ88_16860 [Paracoccus methylovorus]
MPVLDDYLSPQAQQAFVAGLFIATGWWVVAFQNRRRDAKLRAERVDDMQRALLAEIRAHVVSLENQRLDSREIPDTVRRIRDDGFIQMLPDNSNDRIFSALIEDVHILPALVIDPVVTYYRQIALMRSFETELPALARRNRDRAAEMFLDYLELSDVAREAGYGAIRILLASLHGGDATILELYESDTRERADRIAANLPSELAEMRARLNRRSSDRSGL